MLQKDGVSLASLEEWKSRAKPKHAVHWREHRSAMESARAWLEAGARFPREIEDAIRSHPDFGPILGWQGEPEARVRFDELKGEPPNIDVVLEARDATGPFAVAVEAKADETFGRTLAGTLAAARKRLATNPRSGGVARVEALARGILGSDVGSDAVAGVRYQLLTASAAALAQAERQGADRAVLLVHEFRTPRTNEARQRRNAADLDDFVSRLSRGAVAAVPEGTVVGPFAVPGEPIVSRPARFYVGKAVRNLRGGDTQPR